MIRPGWHFKVGGSPTEIRGCHPGHFASCAESVFPSACFAGWDGRTRTGVATHPARRSSRRGQKQTKSVVGIFLPRRLLASGHRWSEALPYEAPPGRPGASTYQTRFGPEPAPRARVAKAPTRARDRTGSCAVLLASVCSRVARSVEMP